jgi:hypothetical protein
VTVSIHDKSITMLCHYAECRILFIIMLNIIMLSVIMLSVIMLSVIMLSVMMLSVIMPSIVAPLALPTNITLIRNLM